VWHGHKLANSPLFFVWLLYIIGVIQIKALGNLLGGFFVNIKFFVGGVALLRLREYRVVLYGVFGTSDKYGEAGDQQP
jgi:tellurite resistance protein TehA-like permease